MCTSPCKANPPRRYADLNRKHRSSERHATRQTQAESHLDASPSIARGSRTDRHSKDVEYWRAQLAGEFPQLQLPFDRAKVAGPFRSSAVERFELSPSLTGRLKQLGAESGCPPYASLVASVAALLQRYSGLDEITIGAKNNWGEPHEFGGGLEPDGNLLALRIDLSGEPSFQKLQSRVHAALMDAAAHGSAAFTDVLNEIRARQD